MSANAMLMSIKPTYVEKIFSGKKTVELRRTKPKAMAGSPVLVYSSSPQRSLMGIVYVKRIVEDTPEKMWPRVRAFAGVTKKEFDAYFEGADKAIAIFIDRASCLDSPVALDELRNLIPRFQPPQSYIYLRDTDPHARTLMNCVIPSKFWLHGQYCC